MLPIHTNTNTNTVALALALASATPLIAPPFSPLCGGGFRVHHIIYMRTLITSKVGYSSNSLAFDLQRAISHVEVATRNPQPMPIAQYKISVDGHFLS